VGAVWRGRDEFLLKEEYETDYRGPEQNRTGAESKVVESGEQGEFETGEEGRSEQTDAAKTCSSKRLGENTLRPREAVRCGEKGQPGFQGRLKNYCKGTRHKTKAELNDAVFLGA